MGFVATISFIGAFAANLTPLDSCAVSAKQNRCGVVNPPDSAHTCSCDDKCLSRGDCCVDHAMLCEGACPAHHTNKLLCRDNKTECDPMTHPDAEGCCGAFGGKLKCPSSRPYMCTGANMGSAYTYIPTCGDDHCCVRSPQLCAHYTVDRSLLQHCPTVVGESPSVCPYNDGPLSLAGFAPVFIGSRNQKYFVAANFTTRSDGRLVPSDEWQFCPPNDELTTMMCRDGSRCDVFAHELGWNCCAEFSGRYKCPASVPIACSHDGCGIDGKEFCCASVAHGCAYPGAIHLKGPRAENSATCVEPLATVSPLSTASAGETRQCGVNFPVLCAGNSTSACVKTKKDCATVQVECPKVPDCEATGEWEKTVAGGTARAPCGEDAEGNPREGTKYRPCVSEFVGGAEVVRWGNESEAFCRFPTPKCEAVVTENNDRIPYLSIGIAYSVKKTDCPYGEDGASTYRCVWDAKTNETKHEVVQTCDVPCTRESYCNGNGNATSHINDYGEEFCFCECDANWYGIDCDIHVFPVTRTEKIEGQCGYMHRKGARPLIVELAVTESVSPDSWDNVEQILAGLMSPGHQCMNLYGHDNREASTVYVFSNHALNREEARTQRALINSPSFKEALATALANGDVALTSGGQFQESNLLSVSSKGRKQRSRSFRLVNNILRAILVCLIIACVVVFGAILRRAWRRRNRNRESGDVDIEDLE